MQLGLWKGSHLKNYQQAMLQLVKGVASLGLSFAAVCVARFIELILPSRTAIYGRYTVFEGFQCLFFMREWHKFKTE